MKTLVPKRILIHPLYITSLLLLIMNDWLFKGMFHNIFTGKLSDFTGLFIFPIFFSLLMPKHIKTIHVLTGLAFIFWKTEFSQPLFNFIYVQGWQIERVIDYSDLVALISILCSYRFIKYYQQVENHSLFILSIPRRSLTYVILAISFFAFCATSPIRPVPMQGDYNLEKDVYSELTEDEIIEKLKANGYTVEKGLMSRDWKWKQGSQQPIINNDLLLDTSTLESHYWHLLNVPTKNDTLQVLNIFISESSSKKETNIMLVGMCVDSTKRFWTKKDVKKYDKYLKRKILKNVKK